MVWMEILLFLVIVRSRIALLSHTLYFVVDMSRCRRVVTLAKRRQELSNDAKAGFSHLARWSFDISNSVNAISKEINSCKSDFLIKKGTLSLLKQKGENKEGV